MNTVLRDRLLGVLLGLALSAPLSATFAQDGPAPRPLADLVREAQEAFDGKREKPFAALVAAVEGDFAFDPWIVASTYAATGLTAHARAFAAAGSGPRWEGLDRCLARPDVPRSPEEVALRTAVVAAVNADDSARILGITDALAKGPVPSTVLALDTLLERARALFAAGRGAEAVALARSVAGQAERIGWTAGRLAAAVAEGLGAQDPLQLDVIVSANTLAAELARRIGNAVEEGQALSNLATARGMAGEYAPALEALERAAEAYDRAPPAERTSIGRAILLMNLGELRADMGEAAGARLALDRAVEILRGLEPGRDDEEVGLVSRRALSSLCNAKFLTGDSGGALATLRELDRAATAAADAATLATARALEGRVRIEAGDWTPALESLRAARDRFEALSDERMRFRTMHWMGHCLRQLGRPREAVELLRATVAAMERLRDPVALPSARRELAEALLANGGRDEAIPLLRSSLAAAIEIGQRADAVSARIALAETLLAAGDAPGALSVALAAAEDVPSLVRDTAQTEAAGARRRWARCYDVGVRAASDLGDVDGVVRFLELGRAGALLEGLRGRGGSLQTSVDERLLRESIVRRRARAAAELALSAAVGGDAELTEIAARRATLAAAIAAERELTARIQRESRAAARVVYPTPVDAATARAALGPGEALVIYRALPDRTVAAIITRATARFVRLAPPATWEGDAARLATPILGPAEDLDAAAARVRKALVEPLGLGADVSCVLLSPDGALGTLPPFRLFPDRATAFVPSATALHVLRSAPRSGSTAALAAGDPDYASEPAFAPLPGTRAEVTALAEPKTVLLGPAANPRRLIAELSGRAPLRLVHLACHGAPDARDPWGAAVVLSAGAEGSGRLTALEMTAAPFRADLVTLSACELAGGASVDAEGAVGVPQALLIAGARCVLANLWRADDEAARLFMESFYGEWRDGRSSAAAALRIAQARVRDDPRWKESKYWAGWVLWGSPD